MSDLRSQYKLPVEVKSLVTVSCHLTVRTSGHLVVRKGSSPMLEVGEGDPKRLLSKSTGRG